MRVLSMLLLVLLLPLAACTPKQEAEKPAQTTTSEVVAPKEDATDNAAGPEDPIGDVEDFSVNDGGNSASSRR